MAPPRIVSLSPSATEIVAALGLENCLVGRSHACDYPPTVQHLPECTTSFLGPESDSRRIHDQVSARVAQGVPLYRLNVPLLQSLRPDLVITQAQCAVCAVSEEELREAVKQWKGPPPRILSLALRKFGDLWKSIREVAEALDAAEAAQRLIRPLKDRCVDIIMKASPVRRRPRVGCIEWTDPLMAAGNWVPDMVELVAGKNAWGESGRESLPMASKALLEVNPEIMVIMPCGLDLAGARRAVAPLQSLPGWHRLKCVRSSCVFIVDGSHYFNRPGPRLVDSLEMLAEIVLPRLFHFGYRGKGWEPLVSE